MIQYPVLETSRLLLRELSLTDRGAIFEHFTDPEVTQFMDIEPCKDINAAEEIIRFHLNDRGCRYALIHKMDGNILGTCGYHCWVRGNTSRAEIGFDLSRKYWGHGYMQEALTEMIRFGFVEMKLDLIEATVDPGNIRSQSLLERMNFRQDDAMRDDLFYYTLRKHQVPGDVVYRTSDTCSADEVAEVFRKSGIRRPVGDIDRIQRMIHNGDEIITARNGDILIGFLRAITDYAYCCYISDIAVDQAYQGLGIGRELIRLLKDKLGDEEIQYVLTSAPKAVGFYETIGFERAGNAFVIKRKKN